MVTWQTIPLRIVQTLPGVAGGDDFRSEYSVRGSPYHHAGVVVDGVMAPWLQHAALGRGDTGTMSMLPSDVVQDATLYVGAYPRRDGGQLGPQLNLVLREGSRLARRFRVGVSGTSATVIGEGPLGSSARGSWLVGLRRSNVEWPVGRDDHHMTVFGFGDVQSKFVYDVRSGQEISLSLVAGVSSIERDDPNLAALSDGVNRAAMVSVAWRSMLGSRTVVTQRVSSLAHEYLNRDQAMLPVNRGANGADAYRVDITRMLLRGVVEAGGAGQAGARLGTRAAFGVGHGGRDVRRRRRDMVRAVWSRLLSPDDRAACHACGRTSIGRLDAGASAGHRPMAPGRMVGWARWLVHGSTGVMHQFADFEHVRGWEGPVDLQPERATYTDLGIGQRLTDSVRWDVTLYARRERDALRPPDVHGRVIDGVLSFDRAADNRFENVLRGSARGTEMRIERRSQTGYSGWVGYSYGVARYTDAARQETFQADFDQRHGINASGISTLAWKTRDRNHVPRRNELSDPWLSCRPAGATCSQATSGIMYGFRHMPASIFARSGRSTTERCASRRLPKHSIS